MGLDDAGEETTIEVMVYRWSMNSGVLKTRKS